MFRKSMARALILAVATIGLVIVVACLLACTSTTTQTKTDSNPSTSSESSTSSPEAATSDGLASGSTEGVLHSYDDMTITIPEGWYLDDSGHSTNSELMIFQCASADEVDENTPFIQFDVYADQTPTTEDLQKVLDDSVISWGGTQTANVELGEVTYLVAGFKTGDQNITFMVGTNPKGNEVDVHLYGISPDDDQVSAIIGSIAFI